MRKLDRSNYERLLSGPLYVQLKIPEDNNWSYRAVVAIKELLERIDKLESLAVNLMVQSGKEPADAENVIRQL